MSYLLAFLGFAALIILHEAGHFAAAKAVGMRVERFSLFFGPLLVKFRRGETEYGIAPIPLGGYVKITGMSPREEIPPEILPRAYYNQAVWKRIVVILAGPAVNFVLAFLLIVGVVLSTGAPVLRHGQPVASMQLQALVAPASQYLRSGDTLVAVDGRRGLPVGGITHQIASHRCAGTPTPGCVAQTPVVLLVRRSGKLLSFTIPPRYDASAKRMRVGFAFGVKTRSVGLPEASSQSVSQMWVVTTQTVSRIAKLFNAQDRKQIHGVVGGFKVTQQQFAFDTTAAIYTLALISLSLAIVNLFPFLPLDGGHIFWALAEKVRGKRIRFELMERAGVVGFLLILALAYVGLSNDISTLTGSGFNTR
ncbi:MAG: site-2 protease family protein [Actinomycetota bacterium]|nr:site-2 protease family protein [Actinomycetota bacterium]